MTARDLRAPDYVVVWSNLRLKFLDVDVKNEGFILLFEHRDLLFCFDWTGGTLLVITQLS